MSTLIPEYRKPAILIVDDRPENLTALEALLGDMEVELVRALSGNEALRQTLKKEIALVLLDVQMPEMDGFETAELIRMNPKTRHLPIIFITAGMKENRFRFKGYDSGAVDYLSKPIEPIVLTSKVRVFTEIFRQRKELEQREASLEEQLQKRTQELIDTANSLMESRELLLHSQKMEAVGRLAGGIAHDFNNILSVIIGYSNLVQQRIPKDDPLNTNIGHIITAANKGADLTGSLLLFSRKQNILMRPVNINDLIENLGKMIRRIIGEDIIFETSFSPEKLVVNADSGQIEQVLMNLATNARDALVSGGKFSIATSQIRLDSAFVKAHDFGAPGMYALICISDTGAGMDQETAQRIFEPYYTTKTEGKGTGLGLAIAYGIISQHGGHINVYSEKGIGTTFRIYLPIVKSEIKADIDTPVEIPEGGTETILLAEDDQIVRDLETEILSGFGYTVVPAVDGREALDTFSADPDRFDLLLLDVIMPRMNGNEAYNEIKKIRDSIKAVFITGYTSDLLENKGLSEEGVEVLMKPVSPYELARKVRSVLDSQQQAR